MKYSVIAFVKLLFPLSGLTAEEHVPRKPNMVRFLFDCPGTIAEQRVGHTA